MSLSGMAAWVVALATLPVFFVHSDGTPDSDGSQADPLRDWISSLVLPMPSDVSAEMPMGLGIFNLRSGHCTDVKLGEVRSEDLSEGETLEFLVSMSGLGISCFVDGDSDGPIRINLTVANSSLDFAVRINPRVTWAAPELPLPLGQVNVTACEADLRLSDMLWEGNGTLYETLEEFGYGLVSLAGSFVNDPLCDSFKSYMEKDIAEMLEQASDMVAMMGVLNPPSPVVDGPLLVTQQYINWDTYPPVQAAQALVEERLPLFAGRVIQILNVAEITSAMGFDIVTVTLADLRIEGSGGDQAATDPNINLVTDGNALGVSAALDGMAFKSVFNVTIAYPGAEAFSHTVNMTLGLKEASMLVRVLADRQAAQDLEDSGAMSSPTCLTQCIEGSEEAVQFKSFDVELRPLLQIHSGGDLETQTSKLINYIINALYEGYLPTMNALLNGVLGMMRDPLSNVLRKQISTVERCEKTDIYFLMSEDAIQGLWFISVLLSVIGLPIAAVTHFGFQCSVSAAEAAEESSARSPTASQEYQEERKALCFQSFIPTAVTVYFPFAVLSVGFLFGYADLDLGATVTLVMSAGKEVSEIGPLFAFSLVGTVVHCWNSKAYFIAIITVIASGLWPFFKLASLLAAWMIPPRYLSVVTRGHILHALDTWGKYSFLDSWFLVVTLSAFAINWTQSLGDTSMRIQTTPAPAFYAFFIATVLSLILGHVASESHLHAVKLSERRRRRAQRKVEERALEDAGDLQAVEAKRREFATRKAQAAPLCRFTESRAQRVIVATVLAISALLTGLGTFSLSFSFRVSGILPQFLFGHETEAYYSLFSIGMATAKDRWDDTGLLGLETVFILLAVVVPLVLLLGLLVLWIAPLRFVDQRGLLHACWMLDAWASLDVAVLVMIILCFQFSRLANFLVYEGDFAAPCLLIKDLTKEDCLMITLNPHPGLALLFVTGILLLVVPKVVMHLAEQAMVRRRAALDVASSAEAASEKKLAAESNSVDNNPNHSDNNPNLSEDNPDKAEIPAGV